jgi:replicative DNA helicase
MNKLELDLDYFENIVVYNSLINPSYLETIIDYIEPQYFKNKDIRSIFDVLVTYYNTYNKTPNITELKSHLTNDEQKIALKNVVLSFKTIDSKYNFEVLIENTQRFLRERAVYYTLLKTSAEVQQSNVNTTQILSNFEKACNISLIDDVGFDYLENIDQHCEDLLKVFKYIPTGWKWLDEKLSGGLLSTGKSLYVFCGATNVGKSIFLGNIATNILKQQKTVLLISLEMSESVYTKRISTQISQIPMNEITTHVESLKDILKEYKNTNNKSKLIVKEFPPKSITVNHLKSYINKLKRKDIHPDVIIIDYVNLLSPVDSKLNSYEGIKQITEGLRALSYTFECPVVSATQINRSGYDTSKPGLETTSESMGLSHTVDAQFSIWTEEGDNELGIIHLGIMKNRFGPRDIATTLEINYPTLTLLESGKEFSTKSPIDVEDLDVTNTLDILEDLSD